MSEFEISTRFERSIIRMESDGDGRTLSGIILPWNVEARVQRPVAGWESYAPGALTRSIDEARVTGRAIPLLGIHEESGPVGRMVESHSEPEGQHATFRLFGTRAAQDAAELVREGVWTSFSVGGNPVVKKTDISTRRGQTVIRRKEIDLDHVALLRRPAFEDAKVLALRGEDDDDLAAVIAARKRKRQRLLGSAQGGE